MTGIQSLEDARLLVVDDEPQMRNSLCALLRIHGFQPVACENGQEAISMLMAGDVDLLLLDLNLGDIDGLSLLDMIRRTGFDTMVVVVSGDTMIDSAIGALRLGAVDYVRKPYVPEVLVHTIKTALQRRRLQQSNRKMAGQLEDSERMHRFLVDISPDLIFTLDENARFTFLNDRVGGLIGYAPEELRGRSILALVVPRDVEKVRYALEGIRESQRTIECHMACNSDAPEERYFELRLVPVEFRFPTGSIAASSKIYGIARDITEKKSAEDRLAYLAYHDVLTGLPNRALFRDRLGLAIVQAKRSGCKVAAMFVDLDRFKLANDTFGHLKGDELLRQVALRLQSALRGSDTLARIGGDEFTILLPGLNCKDDAATVAAKLVADVGKPFIIDGCEVFLTGSVGIAVYPDDGEEVETLIRHADIAMYDVKSHGKNGFGFFSSDMGEISSHRFNLENEIRRALEHEQFELFYQPQIDFSNRRVVGCEALIRWRHPSRGMVSAGGFLDVIEEIGMMAALTDWVVERACQDLRSWWDCGLDLPRMSVNVAPSVLEDGDFCDRLLAVVDRHGIPHHCFEIELTENTFIADQQTISTRLLDLARKGVRIAIDDFGTQYSSLGYLRNLPVTTLKIDQSFVLEIEPGTEDSPIVRAIVAIASGLGLHIVAEGVETALQAEYLDGLGVREMQGFLLGRPMSAGMLQTLLNGSILPTEPVA